MRSFFRLQKKGSAGSKGDSYDNVLAETDVVGDLFLPFFDSFFSYAYAISRTSTEGPEPGSA